MSKIAIITCSTSGLDYIDGYEDIESGRTTIIIDGKEYIDGIDLQPEKFYELLGTLDKVPKTAQPSPNQLLNIYSRLKEKGYTDAIYISISEYLSGTYQGVCLSTNYVDDFNIHPFNSRTASYVTGFMAMKAHQMAKEGATVHEILAHLEKMRDNTHIFFMVGDLKHLVKNGRLSNASAFMASILKINPLLEVSDEGEIVASEKIRTVKKALRRIVERFFEETNNGSDVEFSFLFNTQAPEHVRTLTALLETGGYDTKAMITVPLSPAIGSHIGTGAVGIGYIKKV